MANSESIRATYEAYLRGEASLDDVVRVTEHFSERYAFRSGAKPAPRPRPRPIWAAPPNAVPLLDVLIFSENDGPVTIVLESAHD